jgi:alpha-ketoglutarate-dependent taurine dioxygenase
MTPRFVLLARARAPLRSGEGATVLVDTVAVWRSLPPTVREEWRSLRFVYRAPDLHQPLVYPLVTRHPRTGEEVIRIVEPRRADTIGTGSLEFDVVDRSPADSQRTVSSVVATLEENTAWYDHHWRTGDIVIMDNLAVLHGRRASAPGSSRLVRRVHVA